MPQADFSRPLPPVPMMTFTDLLKPYRYMRQIDIWVILIKAGSSKSTEAVNIEGKKVYFMQKNKVLLQFYCSKKQ